MILPPKTIDGNLFAVPDGAIIQYQLKEFRCYLCGYWKETIFATVVAENEYTIHDDVWKRKWRYLTKCACGCDNYIWLVDDVCPINCN